MPLLVAGGARVNVSVDVEGSWGATADRRESMPGSTVAGSLRT